MNDMYDLEELAKKEAEEICLIVEEEMDEQLRLEEDERRNQEAEQLHLSDEEKAIMMKIQDALKDHGILYKNYSDQPRVIDIEFALQNKPFKLYIILLDDKIHFKLVFPFRTQSNAITFMTMYMIRFNATKAFASMNLDIESGEITMDYSYVIRKAEKFDRKEFDIYMASLIHPAQEEYIKLAHMAIGNLTIDDLLLYSILIGRAQLTLEDEYDDEDITYGTSDLELEYVTHEYINEAKKSKQVIRKTERGEYL